MKIYNKVVIDIESGETLFEDSFEYSGPVALCGGGSAGGGGGTHAAPDADYKAAWREAFDDTGTDSLTESLVSVVETATTSGGNPYSGEVAYDPSTELSTMQTRYDTFDTDVEALAHDTDWEGNIDTAVGKLSVAGLASAEDISSIVTSAISKAIGDAAIVMNNAVSSSISKASSVSSIALPEIDGLVNSIIDDANTDALSYISTGFTDAKSDVESDTNDIVNSIVTQAQTKATALINMAVSSAVQASSSEVIQGLRDAFETRKTKSHLRSLGRFSATMADANAVVGNSAFVIGLALLESDFQDELDSFDSENSFKVFSQVLGHFADSFKTMFSAHLETYIRSILHHVSSVVQLNEIRSRISGDISKDQIALVDSLAGKQSGHTYGEFDSYLKAQVGMDVQFNELKNRFILQESQILAGMLQSQMDFNFKAVSSQAEISRMGIVSFSEQYVQDLQIDIGDARWDLEAFQYMANLLGSFHGGTVTNPSSVTKTQSVLGGAFAGASIGGSVGGPVGMGIGAAVGAAAGYFM